MVNALVAAVAVLLWVVTVLRLVLWARDPLPGRGLLVLVFAGLAVSATFFTPGVYTWAETALGVPNIPEPLARTGVLVAAWGAQGLAHEHVPGNPSRVPSRARLAMLGGTLTSLWLLFLAADLSTPTLHFTRAYGGRPMVVGYLLASLAYLSWALIDVLLGTRAWARRAGTALALGPRLISWGCIAGCGYVAVKVTALGSLALRTQLPEGIEATSGRGLAVAGGVLVAAGCAAPWAALCLTRVSAWWTARRALLALRALWQDLAGTTEVAFHQFYGVRSRHRERLMLRGVRELLYRRVIEIRDAQLELRPYLDADVALAARRRLGQVSDVEAAVEAALLSHGVRAVRRGTPAAVAAQVAANGATRVASDLQWLLRVAACYPDEPTAAQSNDRMVA